VFAAESRFANNLNDCPNGVQLKKEKQEASASGGGEEGATKSSSKVIPAAQRRVQKGLPLCLTRERLLASFFSPPLALMSHA